MARHVTFAIALMVATLGAPPTSMAAATATDALRPVVDKVLRVLDDSAMKGEPRTVERRAALRSVMETAIDFPEASRRALALHWRTRTPAEREEFTALFRDLVTYSYIRMMEPYAGEKVQFVGETEADGSVTVQTRILRLRGDPVPVDYRMHRRGSRWLVYDVAVEGVSLVATYRAQFNTIIQTSSYEELVRRLRVRVAELGEAPSASIRSAPRPRPAQ